MEWGETVDPCGCYGLVRTGGSGFEWSSYGLSHQSKNVHVRFHESI